jgi:serine/threonine protein phosphatase PrpC
LDFKEPRRFVECEPDVKRLVPLPGDNLVVLGSDGLWDVMSDQEAVDCANAALVGKYGRRERGLGV